MSVIYVLYSGPIVKVSDKAESFLAAFKDKRLAEAYLKALEDSKTYLENSLNLQAETAGNFVVMLAEHYKAIGSNYEDADPVLCLNEALDDMRKDSYHSPYETEGGPRVSHILENRMI